MNPDQNAVYAALADEFAAMAREATTVGDAMVLGKFAYDNCDTIALALRIACVVHTRASYSAYAKAYIKEATTPAEKGETNG
jgi:hypothetical protein